MKHVNQLVGNVRMACMLSSENAQVGVWYRLLCYCHEQMNGGIIMNCSGWSEASWNALRLSKKDVSKDSPLWHWGGIGNLTVHLYDKEAERVYITKMKRGKEYAMRRWEKTNSVKPVKDGSPIGSPNGSKMGHPMRKEGRKEGDAPPRSAKPPVAPSSGDDAALDSGRETL